MTTMERINELKANFDVEQETTKEVYLQLDAELVNVVGECIKGAEILCNTYGTGKITAFEGKTLDSMIVDIVFEEGTIRRFSLMHIMSSSFIKFADISEIRVVWDCALEAHNKMTVTYKECEQLLKQRQVEAEKKAEADKKAEIRYQKQKEQAIKSFEQLVQEANTSLSTVDEFYYALGWMAKHIGSISAALPDYLESSFTKHFGTKTNARIVDSKKRTVNGNSMQWTFGFKATLHNPENVPAILNQYLSNTGKAIANTSFIWDLIDNYGFQFGKKQSTDKIKSTVPSQFISSFEAGLTA